MSDQQNPYQSPKTRVSNEDDKVTELLLRYKRKLKVVNMLRQDGMTHAEAMNTVNQFTPIAQSMINQ